VVTFLVTDVECSTRRWEADAAPLRATKARMLRYPAATYVFHVSPRGYASEERTPRSWSDLTRGEAHRMPEEFVLYELPSEVWAVEFSNLFGDRVVELVGTEHAARQTAEHYEAGTAVLFRSRTDFQPVST